MISKKTGFSLDKSEKKISDTTSQSQTLKRTIEELTADNEELTAEIEELKKQLAAATLAQFAGPAQQHGEPTRSPVGQGFSS